MRVYNSIYKLIIILRSEIRKKNKQLEYIYRLRIILSLGDLFLADIIRSNSGFCCFQLMTNI